MRTRLDILRAISINLDILETELELDTHNSYVNDLIQEAQDAVQELKDMEQEPVEGEYWLRKRYKLNPNEPVSKITDIRDFWQG